LFQGKQPDNQSLQKGIPMTKSSRRDALKIAGLGSMLAAVPAQAQHQSISGPLANATVSFGQWKTDPPTDRFLPFSPAIGGHHITPQEVTIKAGGSVNFIISGFHLVLVYGDGTQPGSINVSNLIPGTPPLINDDVKRIFRGSDPRTQSQDRVEVVHFHTPGTYLVICGVLPHFNDGMVGFVRVLA
jgi:plastocyanin